MYRYYKVSQSICDDDQLEYRYGVVCNTTFIISFSVERIKERIDEQSDIAAWVDIKKLTWHLVVYVYGPERNI